MSHHATLLPSLPLYVPPISSTSRHSQDRQVLLRFIGEFHHNSVQLFSLLTSFERTVEWDPQVLALRQKLFLSGEEDDGQNGMALLRYLSCLLEDSSLELTQIYPSAPTCDQGRDFSACESAQHRSNDGHEATSMENNDVIQNWHETEAEIPLLSIADQPNALAVCSLLNPSLASSEDISCSPTRKRRVRSESLKEASSNRNVVEDFILFNAVQGLSIDEADEIDEMRRKSFSSSENIGHMITPRGENQRAIISPPSKSSPTSSSTTPIPSISKKSNPFDAIKKFFSKDSSSSSNLNSHANLSAAAKEIPSDPPPPPLALPSFPWQQRSLAFDQALSGEKAEKDFKRQKAIEELVKTEASFIMDLALLKTLFMDRMKFDQVIPQREITEIFGNLEIVSEEADRFYADIQIENTKPAEDQDFGCVFLKPEHSFQQLSTLVGRHSIASELIKSHFKRPRFVSFLNEIRTLEETNKLTLEDYMIKPLQRLCKYPLLIMNIINNTQETSHDIGSLFQAKKKMEGILQLVNKKKAFNENCKMAIDLQTLFIMEEGLLGLPDRKRQLLKNDVAKKVVINGSEINSKEIILFDDYLVLGRQREKFYTIRYIAPLTHCFIWDSGSKDFSSASLQLKRTDVRDTVKLSFESVEKKNVWHQEFSKLIGDCFSLP